MRLLVYLALLPLLLVTAPVAAACSVSIGTPGQLRLSSDGTVLGSDVGLATPATFTTSLGLLESAHVDVGAPVRTSEGSGYKSASESNQISYTAAVLGVLTVATQPFTSSPTTVATGILGQVTITFTLHNRITNPSSFTTGHYSTRTIVTCRP